MIEKLFIRKLNPKCSITHLVRFRRIEYTYHFNINLYIVQEVISICPNEVCFKRQQRLQNTSFAAESYIL